MAVEHGSIVGIEELPRVGRAEQVREGCAAYIVRAELVLEMRRIAVMETDGRWLSHLCVLAGDVADVVDEIEPINCELMLSVGDRAHALDRRTILPLVVLGEPVRITLSIQADERPETIGFRARCTFLNVVEQAALMRRAPPRAEWPDLLPRLLPRDHPGVLQGPIGVAGWRAGIGCSPRAICRAAVEHRYVAVGASGGGRHSVRIEHAAHVVDRIQPVRCRLELVVGGVAGDLTPQTSLNLAALRRVGVELVMVPDDDADGSLPFGFRARLTVVPSERLATLRGGARDHYEQIR